MGEVWVDQGKYGVYFFVRERYICCFSCMFYPNRLQYTRIDSYKLMFSIFQYIWLSLCIISFYYFYYFYYIYYQITQIIFLDGQNDQFHINNYDTNCFDINIFQNHNINKFSKFKLVKYLPYYQAKIRIYNLSMGASKYTSVNKCLKYQQINIDNWISLPFSESCSYSLCKNKYTQQICQVYCLQFSKKSQFHQYCNEFYQWRSITRQNIIQMKYLYIDTKQQNWCNQNHYYVKCFVQPVAITLKEIKDLPINQTLSLIISAITAFQYLYSIFGYFQITQQMIGINQQGIVKVWHNQDLSINYPQKSNQNYRNNTKRYLNTQQQRFILNLIELIDKNSEKSQQSIRLRKYLSKKYPNNIGLDLKHYKKQILLFAQQNKIQIPSSLISILDLLFTSTQQQQQSNNQSKSHNHILYGKQYQNNYLLGQSIIDGQRALSIQKFSEDQQGGDIRGYQRNDQVRNADQVFVRTSQFLNINHMLTEDNPKLIQSNKILTQDNKIVNRNEINFKYNNLTITNKTQTIVYPKSMSYSTPTPSISTALAPMNPLINSYPTNNTSYPYVSTKGILLPNIIRQQQVQSESFGDSFKTNKFQTQKEIRISKIRHRKYKSDFKNINQNKINQSQIDVYKRNSIDAQYRNHIDIHNLSHNYIQHNQKNMNAMHIKNTFIDHQFVNRQLDQEIANDLRILMQTQA